MAATLLLTSLAAASIYNDENALLDRMRTTDPASVPGVYAVLVNANNRTVGDGAALMELVRALYLGERDAWPTGEPGAALARPEGSAADTALRELVLGLSAARREEHFRRMTGSGGRAPPRAVGSPAELVLAVAATRGAFGVVAEGEVERLPAMVRVLFRFSAREPPGSGVVSLERVLWDTARLADGPGLCLAYLEAFPDGAFADQARARMALLTPRLTGADEPDATGPSAGFRFRVLRFDSPVDVGIYNIHEESGGGSAIGPAVAISDDDILANETLQEAIVEYFDARAYQKKGYGRYRLELEEIVDVEILSRSGNRVTLAVIYRWTDGVWYHLRDKAEVLIEILPDGAEKGYADGPAEHTAPEPQTAAAGPERFDGVWEGRLISHEMLGSVPLRATVSNGDFVMDFVGSGRYARVDRRFAGTIDGSGRLVALANPGSVALTIRQLVLQASFAGDEARGTIRLSATDGPFVLRRAAPIDDRMSYRILRFETRGGVRVYDYGEDSGDGPAIQSTVEISDDEILASEGLRRTISEYFDARAFTSGSSGWGRRPVEMDDIHSIEILERSGDRAKLKLVYSWFEGTAGERNDAEVLVKLIPGEVENGYAGSASRYVQGPLLISKTQLRDAIFAFLARAVPQSRKFRRPITPEQIAIDDVMVIEDFAGGLTVEATYRWQGDDGNLISRFDRAVVTLMRRGGALEVVATRSDEFGELRVTPLETASTDAFAVAIPIGEPGPAIDADILDDPAVERVIDDFLRSGELIIRDPRWGRRVPTEATVTSITDMNVLGTAGNQVRIEVGFRWRDAIENSWESFGAAQAVVTIEKAGKSYRVVAVEFPGL